MKLKISIILGLFMISFFLQNCCGDEFPYFDIMGLDVRLIGKNSTIPDFEIIENDTLNLTQHNLNLIIDFDVNYITNFLNNSQFIAPVYGTSCIGNGELGSKEEKFEEFSIITKNDLDSTHMAGDTINNMFEIYTFLNGFIPFDEYLLFNSSDNIERELLRLNFLKNIDINTQDEFILNISIKLSTGEEYESETHPIYLNL